MQNNLENHGLKITYCLRISIFCQHKKPFTYLFCYQHEILQQQYTKCYCKTICTIRFTKNGKFCANITKSRGDINENWLGNNPQIQQNKIKKIGKLKITLDQFSTHFILSPPPLQKTPWAEGCLPIVNIYEFGLSGRMPVL